MTPPSAKRFYKVLRKMQLLGLKELQMDSGVSNLIFSLQASLTQTLTGCPPSQKYYIDDHSIMYPSQSVHTKLEMNFQGICE